jgi:hypothetical protein
MLGMISGAGILWGYQPSFRLLRQHGENDSRESS